MASQKPGLEPGRKLEATNVQFEIQSSNPEHKTSSNFDNVQSGQEETDAVDNTTANQNQERQIVTKDVQDSDVSDAQHQDTEQTPELTERADNRIQALANQREQERQARLQAEARANQYEAMLQNMVNAQTAKPELPAEEVLAKQYRSYNAQLGYPEDPKEFIDFNKNQAAQAAKSAAMEEARRQSSQDDMNRALLAHPELATDTVLQAMVAAKQAEAQKRGFTLSYSQATEMSKKEMAQRFQNETSRAVSQDDASKNEAYVETTRGASTNRSSVQTPSAKDLDSMSLAEMERALKQAGEW